MLCFETIISLPVYISFVNVSFSPTPHHIAPVCTKLLYHLKQSAAGFIAVESSEVNPIYHFLTFELHLKAASFCLRCLNFYIFPRPPALVDRGDLYTWGTNGTGCLGLGNLGNQFFPLRVSITQNVL